MYMMVGIDMSCFPDFDTDLQVCFMTLCSKTFYGHILEMFVISLVHSRVGYISASLGWKGLPETNTS
jgi:hypothetical protein